MNNQISNQNKNANNKIDVLYKIWLERGFLVKTFEEGVKEDNLEDSIHDMYQLLEEETTKPAKNHE